MKQYLLLCSTSFYDEVKYQQRSQCAPLILGEFTPLVIKNDLRIILGLKPEKLRTLWLGENLAFALKKSVAFQISVFQIF